MISLGRSCVVVLLAAVSTLVWSAGGVVESPTGIAPDRYVYYPGTEELGKEEIRITACGTGLPAARRSQAATCFLAEFGNGDKLSTWRIIRYSDAYEERLSRDTN